MAKEKTVPLGVDIPAGLYKLLRARRDTTGMTIKRIVAVALREALESPSAVNDGHAGNRND